mgnify:CR=1 FL=1
MKYFTDIKDVFSSLFSGMFVTVRHLKDARTRRNTSYVSAKDYFEQDKGIVTLTYPYEALPIPDNGRYRLHNEIDDCIVCDKCAVVCPVDCIAIETIKSPEPIGETSDGSVKRLWAGKFDIDMAKCCYCGLCTTVCPTECLTMTKVYDYSEFDIKNMNYHFTNLSPEKAEEKKRAYEQFVKEKEELKKAKETANVENIQTAEVKPAVPKPAFKPQIKPLVPKVEKSDTENLTEKATEADSEPIKPVVAKPVFKKPMMATPTQAEVKNEETQKSEPEAKPITPKPVMKPVFKKPEPPQTNPE